MSVPYVIDTGFRLEGLSRELSNLFPRPFVLNDVQCGGIEGFLQSLKYPDRDEQIAVASLSGFEAFKIGQLGNAWKDTQLLYWNEKEYPRLSKKYHQLLTRAYDACFDQNVEFVAALVETGDAILTHSIGKHDPTNTTLTEWEYIYQLYRLRTKAKQLLTFG